MKTPKEEAEEMKSKAASLYHVDLLNVRNSIKESIPLAELIAVARAANQLVSAHTAVTHHNYEALLIDALIALRATGKVTL